MKNIWSHLSELKVERNLFIEAVFDVPVSPNNAKLYECVAKSSMKKIHLVVSSVGMKTSLNDIPSENSGFGWSASQDTHANHSLSKLYLKKS